MTEIKKNAPEGAQEQFDYSTKYLTMQIRDYNDPFYKRQLQRRIKREKMIRRREIFGRVVRYTFGSAAVLALWIVMTGM